MALPPSKIPTVRQYRDWLEEQERDHQKAVNEMTKLLASLTSKSEVMITGTPPPDGYKYTGLTFRGLGIYSRARRGA